MPKVTIRQVERLKQDVESLKDKISQTKGRVQQLKLKLDKSGKDAKKTLADLEVKRTKMEQEYGELLDKYRSIADGGD